MIVILLITPVLLFFSCKKETAESPTLFDPAIDGVAVAPVPDIDINMAQRDATVPGYRNTAAFEGEILSPDELSIASRSTTDPNFL